MRRLTFRFYNLAPVGERGPKDAELVERELRAIANRPIGRRRAWWRRRPKMIGVCEAVGRDLPALPGYRIIRDRTTPARANLALYVLHWLPVDSIEWIDLERTWPRVLHPGVHPARSILVAAVRGWLVIVGHAPQAPSRRFTSAVNRGLASARIEWTAAMVRMAHSAVGPVLVLTDPNGLGPRIRRALANLGRLGVGTGGTAVEAVHVVGAVLVEAHTPGSAFGVPMLSDHRRYLRGRARRR